MAVTEHDSRLETLGLDPGLIAREIGSHMHRLSADVTSSELVYSPTQPQSYYHDFLAKEGKINGVAGFRDRLDRHVEQMANMRKERAARQERELRAGRFEFRVEPNRTDGQGGYFSPPAWLNELFATANRPGRVLSGLARKFPLPAGFSQINTALMTTGTIVETGVDLAAAPDQDIVDSSNASTVVPLVGQADMSLQLLEMSPPGAHMDWAAFMDMSEAYDYQLEQQLIFGTGGTNLSGGQLLGVTQVTGVKAVTYTSGTPAGSAMYPYFGQAVAQVGNNRLKPPECWLMRTARWAWIQTQEDTATLPFGLYSPFFLGNTDDTPDPIGGILGLPVFPDDAIPATQGAGGNQDQVIALRPTDIILLEGEMLTEVMREPLSGSLGVRLQSRCYAAALTARRPAGISVISGTGMVVQSGFSS